MLSIASGHDVGYLTGAVGGGRENYYTGAVAAGEPPGLWYGAGAATLGLRGEVDAEQMEAIYSHLLDPRGPATGARSTWGEADRLGAAHKNYRTAEDIYATSLEREPQAGPERRAELRAAAERSERQAVSFLDATFSAPKSVSVLGVAFERAANDARAAGDEPAALAWDALARAVEDAVMAGAQAALDYLQDEAGYARVGHHGGGAGQWIDAHQFVVAQFLQHDSRDRDPQLHVHQAILNRVLCADGVWRALDGRAIHTFRAAAAAVGERVMEAHLTRSLGVRFETRPDGKAREVIGIRAEVMDLFSSRRRAIGAKAEKLVAAFRERFHREPSALDRTRISQQATLATRKAKAHEGETLGERLDRWEREARTAIEGGLAEVARHVVRLAQRVETVATWSERDVVERALAAVAKTKQSWTRSDLTRQISDALPGHLDPDPPRVRELLDGLTDVALADAVRLTPEELTDGLPAHLRRADNSSLYSNPSGARYATRGQLAAETSLRAAAARRGAVRFSVAEAEAALARFAESGAELGADQVAAVRGVLTSGACVEVLSAAAGTGKSFTVGALADTWQAAGRRVYGLAPSQIAAAVLVEEGVTARNTAKWLGTQERLDTAAPISASDPGADEAWRLHSGDLVIVDEAGMADTGDLAAIHARCEASEVKLLLVGDPRQLAAVGAGGALADVAEHGLRYELAEVRRFTASWERAASLRLRDGDPDVLHTYARHGRLLDGGAAEQTEAAAARAWLADTLAGRESLLLVSSNEAAARISASLRAELVALGRVAERGVELGKQGTIAGIGDLVQARRNGWELIGFDGNTRAPINRETYRVTDLRPDGGLTVAPVIARGDDGEQLGEPLVLPANYVAADVTLGYASTVHAAQGRTVDTAHAVIQPGTDAAGAYVALTRGRERNTAHVVTTAVPEDAATGETHNVAPRTAHAVLADIIERDPHDQGARSALAEQERAAEAARSIQTSVDRIAAEVGAVTAGRTGALLDWLAAEDAISDTHRVALAADEAYGSLERLLRTAELAGHNPGRVLADTLTARSLDGARHPARVLHQRISEDLRGQLTPRITSYADLLPAHVPTDRRAWLETLTATADERRRELGARTAAEPAQWALEALGPVPDDALARAEWEERAGWAAAHRELVDHGDDADAIGAPPPAGLAEKHASWHAAHNALGLPDGGGDEDELTDGQLRVRVRAFEREETWAPRWVGDELDATHQRAERARTDAQVWAARAEAAQDSAQREQLQADADAAEAVAAALADRAAQLETADNARGAWYAATAATRDAAARATGALKARGVELDDPADQVSAAEWLDAHEAAMRAEDEHRVVRDEADLADPERAVAPASARAEKADIAGTPERVAAPEPVAEADHLAAADHAVHEPPAPAIETDIADIRDAAARDGAEHADPAQRHRVPTADETADAVARAQAALAEIEARRQADDARAAETEEAERREELTRWAEHDDLTTKHARTEERRGDDDDLVLER